MATVGFHASQEQLSPSALLAAVRHAEQAGFQTAMCSDHLAPWSERQGHSGPRRCRSGWSPPRASATTPWSPPGHRRSGRRRPGAAPRRHEQERFIDASGEKVVPELTS